MHGWQDPTPKEPASRRVDDREAKVGSRTDQQGGIRGQCGLTMETGPPALAG